VLIEQACPACVQALQTEPRQTSLPQQSLVALHAFPVVLQQRPLEQVEPPQHFTSPPQPV
jgi:hypothetical protein